MLVSAREGYRRWAATYDQAPNPIGSLVDRSIDLGDIRGKRVIDVACGTGRWAKRTGAIGVDLSFEMLQRSGSDHVVQADARRLPFANHVADLVLCVLALGYCSPVNDVMRELQRIACRGALVVACDIHPKALAAGWRRSFRNGDEVCEIENHAYVLNDLSIPGLTLEDARDLYFGEPERQIYASAGRLELFHEIRDTPAVWMRRWRA